MDNTLEHELQSWTQHHNEFCKHLNSLLESTGDKASLFYPYPVLISVAAGEQLQQLGRTLLKALNFIVCRYLDTPEFRSQMPLQPPR